MEQTLITLLKAISDILTAGVAIIAFSLLIYSMTFKLHDRVTNSFTLLLFDLVIVFGADAFMITIESIELLYIFIKIHWFGIIALPSIYFYFSDAVLEMTGRPSRGKRRIARFVFSGISLIFIVLLATDLLVGEIVTNQPPAPYLTRTLFNDLFSIFFFAVLALSWYNLIRAYYRTLTKTSRRRMGYLVISALGPAIGSFPYLLYGSEFAANMQVLFWAVSVIANASVYISVIAMTYSVSFFGFPWTDRLIKSRLFRWVMRGPITASLTLGVTTLINRFGNQLETPFTPALIIIGMVLTIVMFEFLVTVFAPVWERLFFFGSDRAELEKVRELEDKLLTNNDFKQFLELILATICDRLQVPRAVLIFNNGISDQLRITVGSRVGLKQAEINEIWQFLDGKESLSLIEKLNTKTVVPIIFKDENNNKVLGAIILYKDLQDLDEGKRKALQKLVQRASFALHEREEQERLLVSLEMLTPQTSAIQNLLAKSRFDQQMMIEENELMAIEDMSKSVKDALTQIWGGPKVLRNPIVRMGIVQRKIQEKDESPVNAMRETLKEALMRLRPEGERQYTNEWILYNIIDLKYFEGWKVKEITRKLALSDADFYRKQRDALNALARQIIELERGDIESAQ